VTDRCLEDKAYDLGNVTKIVTFSRPRFSKRISRSCKQILEFFSLVLIRMACLHELNREEICVSLFILT
jgi:hypothetical protein